MLQKHLARISKEQERVTTASQRPRICSFPARDRLKKNTRLEDSMLEARYRTLPPDVDRRGAELIFIAQAEAKVINSQVFNKQAKV